MVKQRLQSTVHFLWQAKGRNTCWVWEFIQVKLIKSKSGVSQ